jgi:hypothetical protein
MSVEAFVFAQHLMLAVLARSVALCREEMEKDAAVDLSCHVPGQTACADVERLLQRGGPARVP